MSLEDELIQLSRIAKIDRTLIPKDMTLLEAYVLGHSDERRESVSLIRCLLDVIKDLATTNKEKFHV